MKRVHIVGRKNSGKTTLIVELVRLLSEQGYRVGTIKHTHHSHELDAPGKDSHQHRQAGSSVVGILSPGMTAVFQAADDPVSRDASRYDSLAPMFAGCDLVLVEGDLQTDAVKIEVWRAGISEAPYATVAPAITAVVTDDSIDVRIPTWTRTNIESLAEKVLSLAKSQT
ncbi:molybdopterin-guanine dinucleotide biosynthesis protein B [Novipirellula aureliae]|nr:molybdopterin-guanine dinucleotide biosynthesis protein B [Novipirellula aureliae]